MFYSILLQLQTYCSVSGYMILKKNEHIIVHLTVSYIAKFYLLHTALSFTARVEAKTILTSAGHGDRLEKDN